MDDGAPVPWRRYRRPCSIAIIAITAIIVSVVFYPAISSPPLPLFRNFRPFGRYFFLCVCLCGLKMRQQQRKKKKKKKNMKHIRNQKKKEDWRKSRKSRERKKKQLQWRQYADFPLLYILSLPLLLLSLLLLLDSCPPSCFSHE